MIGATRFYYNSYFESENEIVEANFLGPGGQFFSGKLFQELSTNSSSSMSYLILRLETVPNTLVERLGVERFVQDVLCLELSNRRHSLSHSTSV